MLVIEDKRSAHLQYISLPNLQNVLALKDARNKIQQTTRRCAIKFWVELSQNIQLAANTENIRGIYDGIKKAVGPVQRKTPSLKSSTGLILTEKNKKIDRWIITQISTLVRTLCLQKLSNL